MFKNTSYFLPKKPTIDNYVKLFYQADNSALFILLIVTTDRERNSYE